MPDNGDRPATKSDIERLDKKIDASVERLDKKIDASVAKLALEIVKTQGEVRDVRTQMGGLATQADVGRILSAIDAFSGKAVHYDRAAALHGHALTEHEVALKEHDRRIKALENPRR